MGQVSLGEDIPFDYLVTLWIKLPLGEGKGLKGLSWSSDLESLTPGPNIKGWVSACEEQSLNLLFSYA